MKTRDPEILMVWVALATIAAVPAVAVVVYFLMNTSVVLPGDHGGSKTTKDVIAG